MLINFNFIVRNFVHQIRILIPILLNYLGIYFFEDTDKNKHLKTIHNPAVFILPIKMCEILHGSKHFYKIILK